MQLQQLFNELRLPVEIDINDANIVPVVGALQFPLQISEISCECGLALQLCEEFSKDFSVEFVVFED